MSEHLDSKDEAVKASTSVESESVAEVKKKKPRARKPASAKSSTTRASRKKTSSQKPKKSVDDNIGNVRESEALPVEAGVDPDSLGSIELKLSKALHRKLIKQSYDEGVSVEEFISELLSEGVVLRAWEIVERKNAMRSNSGNSQQNNRSKGQGNSKGYKNKGHRMSHGRYQSIMDDSSNFLEYVRNQERGRR